MSREKSKVLLDVSEEKMTNKQYELLPLVGASFLDSACVKDDVKTVSQKEFRQYLKSELHKSYYKINQLIDVYLLVGAIQDDGKGNFIVNAVKTKFVGLTKATALYFLETLSEMSLKVYCYLLNKYNIHERYHYKEPFNFSKTQLLEAIGLSRNQTNLAKLNNILFTLEDLGLIEYDHTPHGIPGKHGVYMDLIKVNQYSPTQVKAAQELLNSEPIKESGAWDHVMIPNVKMEKQNQLQEAAEKEDADSAKVWLEVGAYDVYSLPYKYKRAYEKYYGELHA